MFEWGIFAMGFITGVGLSAAVALFWELRQYDKHEAHTGSETDVR